MSFTQSDGLRWYSTKEVISPNNYDFRNDGFHTKTDDYAFYAGSTRCNPVNDTVRDNTYANTSKFCTASAATVMSWGSLLTNNTDLTPPPPAAAATTAVP